MNQCKHDSPIFKITYDNGSLGKEEEWLICESCAKKPCFEKFRISTVRLEANV